MTRVFACGLFIFSQYLIGQTGPPPQTNTIVGAGYVNPAPVSVAPGQILSFFVDGVGSSLTQPVHASTGALPPTLAGITVTLQQGSTLPVPLMDVRPVSMCPGLSPAVFSPACGTLTAVTVQIPYEVITLCPLCLRPIAFPPPSLYVSENGKAGTSIGLSPLADQVHVLSSCDLILQSGDSVPLSNTTGLPCPPMVTHGDGTLVSASRPAKIGEELAAWAVGLGPTNPPAITGQPSSKGVPTAGTFYLDFSYQVNALPKKPFTGRPDVRPPQPLYTGLVPGFVGLYQVNFVVPPEPINGTPLCALPGTITPGANVVQSNLTVSIGGGFSFDGAGICVATHIPID